MHQAEQDKLPVAND